MTPVRCSNSYKIPTFPRSLYSYPDYVLEIKKGNSDSRQISPKVSAVMLIFKSENMNYLKKLVWNLIHYRIGKKLKFIWFTQNYVFHVTPFLPNGLSRQRCLIPTFLFDPHKPFPPLSYYSFPNKSLYYTFELVKKAAS